MILVASHHWREDDIWEKRGMKSPGGEEGGSCQNSSLVIGQVVSNSCCREHCSYHSHPQCLFHADSLTAVATEGIKTYYDVKRPCWSEASSGQMHALCVLVETSRGIYVKRVRFVDVKCIHTQCVRLYIAQATYLILP